MPATSLLDKTIVITGGGSGIGRLMAIGAAGRGARVAIWDIDEAAAQRVRNELRRKGAKASAYAVNVADRDEVTAAAEVTKRELGPVDILINNAGVVSGADFLDIEPERIERTFNVNTLAHFWTTRALLPDMLDRDRGLIVTIASAAGLAGVARQTDYAASKFAAVGFTESLRSELRARGSRVATLLVCPYYIDTGMFAGVKTRFPLLLPITPERRAAVRILKAIERGKARLIFPPMIHTIFLLRLLPTSLADRALDFFGLNTGMDAFVGRAKPGSTE